MTNSQLYYRHAGKAPLGGIIIALLVGLVGASILAVAYAFAIWYDPIAYLNIVICFVFGLLLAYMAGKGAKLGKIRSSGMAMFIALVVALAALYVHWAAYLTLLNHAGGATSFGSGKNAISIVGSSFDFMTFYYFLIHPMELSQVMQYLNMGGFWSYQNFTPTGMALWAMWGLEAAIIIIMALYHVRQAADKPFSEKAECWMEEDKLPASLAFFSDAQDTRRRLEQGDLSPVLQAQTLTPEDKNTSRAKLSLYACSGDENAYLSVQNIEVRFTDKKQKKKKTTHTDVVKFLRLNKSGADKIRQQFGATRAY